MTQHCPYSDRRPAHTVTTWLWMAMIAVSWTHVQEECVLFGNVRHMDFPKHYNSKPFIFFISGFSFSRPPLPYSFPSLHSPLFQHCLESRDPLPPPSPFWDYRYIPCCPTLSHDFQNLNLKKNSILVFMCLFYKKFYSDVRNCNPKYQGLVIRFLLAKANHSANWDKGWDLAKHSTSGRSSWHSERCSRCCFSSVRWVGGASCLRSSPPIATPVMNMSLPKVSSISEVSTLQYNRYFLPFPLVYSSPPAPNRLLYSLL